MSNILASTWTDGIEIELLENGFSINGNFLETSDIGKSLSMIFDYLSLSGIEQPEFLVQDLEDQLD